MIRAAKKHKVLLNRVRVFMRAKGRMDAFILSSVFGDGLAVWVFKS